MAGRQSSSLRIRSVPGKGRGVFAARAFRKNERIEICPVVLVPAAERPHLNATSLHNYYYTWRKGAAIALGMGSIYNHSYEPNARYLKNYREDRIEIIALRRIEKDEEITVNYNGRPASRSPLWFSVI